MDNQNQNEIPEYVKKLPQAVQDFVFQSDWENRTVEIGKKYSLDDTQIDSLSDIVVLVLIGLEQPETFLDTIVKDIGISKLVAEQIMNDLGDRVFEYAIKTVESKEKKPVVEKVMPVTPNAPKVPEVKPNNLPMVEEGEVAHSNPVPSATNQVREQKMEMPKMAEVPKYTPPAPIQIDIDNIEKGDTEKIEMVREPVQEPVPVPRIIAVPLTEDKPEVETKPVETPVINRMPIQENPTSSKINTIKTEADQKPAESSVKKYTADPYREPLG